MKFRQDLCDSYCCNQWRLLHNSSLGKRFNNRSNKREAQCNFYKQRNNFQLIYLKKTWEHPFPYKEYPNQNCELGKTLSINPNPYRQQTPTSHFLDPSPHSTPKFKKKNAKCKYLLRKQNPWTQLQGINDLSLKGCSL